MTPGAHIDDSAMWASLTFWYLPWFSSSGEGQEDCQLLAWLLFSQWHFACVGLCRLLHLGERPLLQCPIVLDFLHENGRHQEQITRCLALRIPRKELP